MLDYNHVTQLRNITGRLIAYEGRKLDLNANEIIICIS